MSRRDGPINGLRLRALSSRCSRTVCAVYKEGTSKRALPSVGQLDGGLRLSPQRLRGDKALEVKRLFPREHVVHGPAQLVSEHGQRFGFAVFVFEFSKVLFARLTLADEEDRGFGKRPA